MNPARQTARDRSFRLWLAGAALAGLVVRALVSAVRPDPGYLSDATYYRLQGLLLARGNGFANPFVYVGSGRVIPTAFHPPLMSIVHSVPSWLGHESLTTAHLVTSAIGCVTIVAIGLLGREVFDDRVGIVAAVIAAASPNLIAPDTNLNSEGLAACLVALSLLAGYRLLARPRLLSAAVFGLALGLATLVRPEVLALAIFVFVPLVRRRAIPWRRHAGLLGTTTLLVLVIVGPWMVRSLTAFEDPVPFSTNGIAVVGFANCPATFGGARLGSWSLYCPTQNNRQYDERPRASDDEAQEARFQADLGTRYIRDHTGTFFAKVLWARVGRTWSLYAPFDLLVAGGDEGKMRWEVLVGVPYFWASVGFAVVGIRRLLRSRTVSVLPLLGPGIVATIVSLVAYGTPRFRVVAEPSIAVLAAIGVCVAWDRYIGRVNTTHPH